MRKIIVGLSNHHVNLSREVCDILFGKNYELKVKRNLKQLGQYACEETVDVYINNFLIPHVRIIGPCRAYTQVELLERDCINAHVTPLYSNSGELEGTLPFTLIGPCGEYKGICGAFIANNHIHFSKNDLEEFGLENGQIVNVKAENGKIIENVIVKSDDTCVLEFHLNKDDGEVNNINSFDEVEIC